MTALSVSGFPCRHFTFIGFSAAGEKQLHQALAAHAESGVPVLVAYESPTGSWPPWPRSRRHCRTAASACCNDLTKRYERVYRGGPAEVLQQLEQNPWRGQGRVHRRFYCEALPAAQEQAQAGLSPEAALTELVATAACPSKAVAVLAGDVRHAAKRRPTPPPCASSACLRTANPNARWNIAAPALYNAGANIYNNPISNKVVHAW